MLFTVKLEKIPTDLAKVKIIQAARRTIAIYKNGPNEIQLDRYLKENYRLGLRQ